MYLSSMVLITDGTNLVGAHLLYKLVSQNELVRAIYKDESKFEEVKRVFSFYAATNTIDLLFSKIDWVKADVIDIPSLKNAFKSISFVYHTACIISFHPKDYFLLRKVNIDGTSNVVNACIEYNIKKICHLSSIEALGKTNDNSIIAEETNWNPEAKNSEYAITKYGAEMEVWRGSQEGLKIIIVNSGLPLGAGFSNSISNTIFNNIYKKSGYYTEGKTGFINVEDIAHVMIQLMKSSIHNEQYILVSETVSFKELTKKIAAVIKRKKSLKKASISILKFKAFFTSKNNTLNTFINLSTLNDTYDNSKIKTALNFNFTPLNETIQAICNRINF